MAAATVLLDWVVRVGSRCKGRSAVARVAAIAIDAAEWPVVETLVDSGHLPNLARIRARSAKCRLRNVETYISDAIWTQLLTGKDAHANRHWGLVVFDPSTYEAYDGGALDARPFYALGQRRKAIVFDVPHSVIAEHVEGAQVTAWGAHGPHYPRAASPRGLLREIDAVFGPHPAFDNDYDTGWYDDAYIDRLSQALLRGASRRLEIASWLTERVPDWGVLLTSMSEVHSAGHHFWHGVDADHPLHETSTAPLAGRRLVEVAHGVDEAIGHFTGTLPPDTVLMVFALHGMGPADDLLSLVLLPELLHRLRFGKPLLRDPDQGAWRRAGYPPVTPTSEEAWAVLTYLEERAALGGSARLRRTARRLLGRRLYEHARRLAGRPAARRIWELDEEPPPETDLAPTDFRPYRKALDWQPVMWYQRYWPRMHAFALPSFDDGHIRINLRGRERDGVVDPGDYRRACDAVVASLRECRDPRTGGPVVADAFSMRADDPMDPEGPDADIVVKWSTALDALEHPTVGLVGPHPHLRTGQHTANGFALFSGPGVQPVDLGERSALDLTPTILELLGEPAPADMSGRSLAAAFRSAEPAAH
jgi:predicted AlkP superfamily phosphohydrolase/phosphomutase